MVEPAAGRADAGPGAEPGRPSRRRRWAILIAGGAFLAVLIVGASLAWTVVLPNVNGRGEHTRVPHALSVLDANESLDRRIASKLEVQRDTGWIRTGGGHYTHTSDAMWSAFTGRIQVNVSFHRHEATALKTGTDAAAEDMDKMRSGETPQPIGGLGDEAFGIPVTSGYEIHVRDRNVTVHTSFSAPADSFEDLKANARPMAETALALLKQANR
ncbi:hypothetical protein [Actinomadura chokoriensis]|uniref:Secreted protein n=1 Tax=Actinomadura chokoriensis TaxID=454156 RepID=A0ABV4RAN9_9ACTN